MTPLVPIALIGWIAVAIMLFAVLQPRHAVLAAYIGGWLFLPQASIDLPGLPDLDKVNVTSVGALLGVLLFDSQRLSTFRFSWVDIPVIVWCVASLPSALMNELPPDATSPLYDGLSGVLKDTLVWGVPYFLGRLYFNSLLSLRELAIAILIGGLIYLPLCLYELRMSPSLHLMVYGFHPSAFEMALRFGGYRPMVFMQHGLMVGMWMASATLIAFWLWRSKSVRHIAGLPMGLIACGLLVTTILCKSVGSLALLLLGVAVLWSTSYVRTAVIISALLAIAPAYMFLRGERLWSGAELVQLATMIDDERAASLQGRFENEDLLTEKASQRPIFGWGGWGRWRVTDPVTGEDITISDGMWVIALGEKGLIGLVSLTAFTLLPVVLLLRRVPAQQWTGLLQSAPAALAIILCLYSLDNLLNAMVNPIYFLAAGGLSGFYVYGHSAVRSRTMTGASPIREPQHINQTVLATESRRFS